MSTQPVKLVALTTSMFRPGMRVAVACSGGADSVALLRTLIARKEELGLVLSVAHMHHAIRGEEADADAAFVAALAERFELQFHLSLTDAPARARENRETLEEAARNLRYAWFRQLMAEGQADAVVTAHTLDDQAETVLHRFLRGAWTEGLAGIHPVVNVDRGVILRPFLAVRRAEIEGFLHAIGQPWQEDSSNQDTAFTRNRLRHQLLPELAEYNPQIQKQLSQLAALARDEEAYWQSELARILPTLLLPGKAVRGGGRAAGALPGEDPLAIEVLRLQALPPALRRRVIRAAAATLGYAIGFEATESLLALCGLGDQPNKRGRKLDLDSGLRAERTPRELRLFRSPTQGTRESAEPVSEYAFPIPGTIQAPYFGIALTATLGNPASCAQAIGSLRAGRPGDRVWLKHSRGPKTLKEVLHRIYMNQPDVPTHVPVLEWQGEIVWMQGAEVESEAARSAALTIAAHPIHPE